jgi:hypothetical protein
MDSTLEERVTVLERQMGIVKQIIERGGSDKDWRNTFGMSADDPGFEEMIRLGRQARLEAREDEA